MLFKIDEVSKGNEILWRKDKNILFYKLKKFINNKINIEDDFFIKNFFKDKKNYELSLKQYIIQKYINVFFNYELTRSLSKNKKFSYGLPKEILKIYEDDIIKINFFISNLKFLKIVIIDLLRGISYFFKIIFNFNNKIIKKNYDKKFFFHSFNKVSIRNKLNLEKNSLFEWFIKINKENFSDDNILISHSDMQKKKFTYNNIQIAYDKYFPIKFDGLKNFYKFVSNFFIIFFINIKDIAFFNWKSSILFSEKVMYLNFHYGNKKEVYNEYFFNNSEWLYRPLWSYAAEIKKSDISMIYYSINDLPTEDISGYENEKNYLRIFHHHEIMTWTKYYAWTEDHKKHLNYVLNENFQKKIDVKGYFIMETGKEFDPGNQKKIICCFPITPIDEVVNVINQRHSNYLTFESCKAFISDIVKHFEQFDIKVFFKLKRNFNDQSNEDYKNFYLNLQTKKEFINLDPETDVEEIIDKSDLIISAPFTSVSTVSKIKGKKTIYYDPTGTLNKPNHNKAAYNVPIIFDLKTINLNDI